MRYKVFAAFLALALMTDLFGDSLPILKGLYTMALACVLAPMALVVGALAAALLVSLFHCLWGTHSREAEANSPGS